MGYKSHKGKIIVGLSEIIRLIGKNKAKKIKARIDTGATKSSVDAKLAASLQLGPVIKTKFIKSAHGNSLRPLIKTEIELAGKKICSEFTIADRAHMRYKVLIGQNILKHGFLIDPGKK